MTARWVVDEIVPERGVNVTWQPISLLFKNEVSEDSEGFAPLTFTHNLLRVMESVRAAADSEPEANAAVQSLYWEYGRRIHHDEERDFTAADAITSAGFDPSHAAAFDDPSWDKEIRSRMDIGLELAGKDIGTPIIAMDDNDGDRVALFGPVITRVPEPEASLQLWDGLIACATVPGFWELKRTRTERPDFGDRP